MTEVTTYHAAEFFEPDLHFAIRRVINRSEEFNLNCRYQREFWKISCIISGEGEIIIDNEAYPVSAGAIYLIHPNSITTYNIKGEALELYNILFDREFISPELELLKDDFHFFTIFSPHLSGSINPLIYIQASGLRLRQAIREIEKEYREQQSNFQIFLKMKLLELLILMQRTGEKTIRRFNRQDLVSYIDHILENEYSSSISLKYLADKVALSPNHLCTVYRQCTRCSIVKHLNDIRLARAASWLCKSGKTISEICYECGFNDLSYFYRSFIKSYGCNPGDYRKKFG